MSHVQQYIWSDHGTVEPNYMYIMVTYGPKSVTVIEMVP